MRRALDLLLSCQFVEAPGLPGRLWRTIRGSGMGLPHSGALCDAAVIVRAERQHAGVLGVRQHHCIDGFWRYKDDVLVLGSDPGLANEFLRRYISFAGYFKIVCENVDSNQCKFLEVIVKKGVCEFLTIPSYKNTNISKPLEMTSAHPPFVHKSWPIALRRRTQALASIRACEIEAMNEFKKAI